MSDGVHNPADLTPALAALIVLQATVNNINANVILILAIVLALPTLTETGGTVTTTVINTEYNVYINAVPLGVFNPVCVKIDCTAQTAGETIVIRESYQIVAGVPARILEDTLTFIGAIAPPMITIDLDPNRFGVSVTIERTGGVARAYPWEVFYEI